MEIAYCGSTIQRITLASGQFLDFSYEAGRVSRITDRAGRSACYGYDGENLTSVTYPNGGVMKYRYNSAGLVVAVTGQNGVEYLSNNYDEKGRVTKQDLANGEEYALLYHDEDRKTTFLNLQSGRRTVYHYNQARRLIKAEFDDGSTQEFEYDQWGNITERQETIPNRFTYYGQQLDPITRQYYLRAGSITRSLDASPRRTPTGATG